MTRDRRHREDAAAWPVVLSAVLLSGAVAAVVSTATVRLASVESPAIASVRLGEIAAGYAAEAAKSGTAPDAVRAWGAALEAALERVAARHGATLLPARAVAAGAPDVTSEVEAALASILARGGQVRNGPPPGDGP